MYLHKRLRQAEFDRKRNYMALYLPHLALGLKDVLDLSVQEEKKVVNNLSKMLERTHLEA